jgi:hypothetical protein
VVDRVFVLRDEPHVRSLHAFLRANARAMAQAGRPLAVHVTEYKARRNSAQNRLYWALLRDISEQAWVDGKQYSSEAWHAYFAGQYIGREETPGGGSIAISTTTLSVHEFADYVTRIQAYAATELGIET